MRPVITERDIPESGELKIAQGTILTPSARDLARERGVTLVELPKGEVPRVTDPERIVAIGSDHGGFRMKEALLPVFGELGLAVHDAGVHDENPVDYPDVAFAVAEFVAGGRATRGVIIDGAGIGSCMAANKVPGIRAALCYDKT
jgi:ribose 5-phosphate isomerase B